MKHCSVHHESRKIAAISLREPVCRDRRKNRFAHHACPQKGKLSEERNRRILISAQIFSSPDTYPGYQSKSKDRMTQDTFGGAHLCGVEPEPSFDVGEKLFDGPAPGESLNQQDWFEIQIGRRQVSGFAFAFAVSDDDDLKLDSGFGPPGDERFVVETDELAVNFDSNLFPAAAGLGHRRKARKTASVFGFAAPLFGFPSGQRSSEDGIETQAAGQRNPHLAQGFEDRLIVVGTVGDNRNLERNPGLDLLKRLDRDFQPGTKLLFGAVFFGSVKRDPKGQSHRDSKEFDDYGQDHPIVSPDVAGPGSFDMIPEWAGAEDVLAPFGAQRIVDGNQKFFELKGLDDQDQKGFEESFGAELEMGEEAVETGFVAFESGSVTEPANMPLAGLNQPGNHRRTQIRPASFGKGQTKTEENFGKFRCRVVSNHSPFSGCVELSSQPLASENGLFFLNFLSRFNL